MLIHTSINLAFMLGYAATFVLAQSMISSTFHDGVGVLHGAGGKEKREILTCEQTYGEGSVTCGGVGSMFCYDPAEGDTCCPLDDGYCKAGDYCASIKGYCCHDDEDETACGIRLGFIILSSTISTSTIPITIIANTTVSPTSTLLDPSIPASTSTAVETVTGAPASISTVEISALTALSTSTATISDVDGDDGFGLGTAMATTTYNGLAPDFTAPVGENFTGSGAGIGSSVVSVVTGTGNGISVGVGSTPTAAGTSGAGSFGSGSGNSVSLFTGDATLNMDGRISGWILVLVGGLIGINLV